MARADFTDQQWQQLVEAAPAIARGVAAASGSAAATEHELEAFLRLLETTRDETASATLLGALAADVHARISSGTVALAEDDVMADSIHQARQAGAVLALERDEQEARAVRYWLLEVARTVAHAGREGGLLGIGGQEVSRPEREMIAAIADALGMSGEPDTPAAEAPDAGFFQAESGVPGGGVASSGSAGTAAAGRSAGADPTALAPDGQPIGADNIREGTVGGIMGGPNQSEGQGQGS